jgi:hypothetical protein
MVCGEALIKGDFPHPSIALQRFIDLPRFSFRGSEDERCYVLGLPPFELSGVPKGSLATVTNGNGSCGVDGVHVLLGAWVGGALPNLSTILLLKPWPT